MSRCLNEYNKNSFSFKNDFEENIWATSPIALRYNKINFKLVFKRHSSILRSKKHLQDINFKSLATNWAQ